MKHIDINLVLKCIANNETMVDIAKKANCSEAIDSAYGYVHDNVWWLHKDINRMKWTFTVDKFLELCKLIISNQGNKHE